MPRRLAVRTPQEEEFCDQFAAALLAPAAVLHNAEQSPAEIFRLRDELDVSAHVLARQAAAVWRDVTIAGLVSGRHEKDGEDCLSCIWSYGSEWIPVRAKVRGVVFEAAERNRFAEGYVDEIKGPLARRDGVYAQAAMPAGGRLMIALFAQRPYC